MRILYLAHRIPYPPNKGDKIRSYNEVRHLTERHQVDLLCLADEPGDLQYQSELDELCSRVAVFPLNKTSAKFKGLLHLITGGSISAGYFYQQTVQRCFDRWVADDAYDAIICFSSSMAEYVFRSTALPALAKSPRLIMDFCDVDSDKWIQYAAEARFPLKQLYRLENRRLAAYEGRIQRHFDRTLVISRAEADLFQQVCTDCLEKLQVVPNGVDHEFFNPAYQPSASSHQPRASNLGPRGSNLSLVFTGAMDYHANVDGVLWFSREIWPVVRQRHPDLQFYSVGSNPTAEVKELTKLTGVTVTGFVEDIRDYYSLADICVVPLRLARGVQNKVLEAMAMGKPVITTSKANAGIQAVDGEQLLIADTVEAFIDHIESLIDSKEKGDKLGRAAREFVTDLYDWQRNLEKLEELIG